MAAKKTKPKRVIRRTVPTYSGLFPPNRPLGKPFPAPRPSREHQEQPKRSLAYPGESQGKRKRKPRKA
jgi:hypothetical protein